MTEVTGRTLVKFLSEAFIPIFILTFIYNYFLYLLLYEPIFILTFMYTYFYTYPWYSHQK